MRSLLKVSLILVLSTVVFADVAPDPGYTNVPADLRLESASDLSAYRFFLESPMAVEEVKLNANSSTTVVSAAGRGGAARYGKPIAVPVADMTISGDLSGSLLDSMIREKQFPNAKVLLSHSFQATIPVIEKPLWSPPVYRLSVENGDISATKLAVVPAVGGRSPIMYAIPVVIAGVLIAIGIAIIGIWLFRRARKNV